MTSSGGSSADDIAPPLPPTAPDAPTDVALTTGITYSTASPLAYIAATWLPPSGSEPTRYAFQVSESSTFPDASTLTFSTNVPSIRADGLKPATAYYARVAGVVRGVQGEWGNGSPFPITTASDTSPAGVPTGVSAVWVGVGDLRIRWTNPEEAIYPNFKDVQIRIFASSGGTEYGAARYRASGEFVYTLAMNYADTAGVGDPSLYVELRSRTFSNVLGTVVNTGLVTKAAPATPTGLTHSWTGDTGTAGAGLTFSWTDAVDAGAWIITLDTVPRRIVANTYTYTLDTNRADHAGTADPAIAYNLVARDGFGQSSSAVIGTATNAAPPAPTATLTAGVISGLYASVTSTPVADFWRYEYVFKRDGTIVATVYSAASSYRYEQQGAGDDGYHSWTVVIRQQDLFGQFSATVTPAAVAFEALTLAGLRSQITYTDSVGNSAVTLAALKDAITTSGGVSYAA